MKDRLRRFLEAENISQAQFADKLDITPASVSHILAGRNKPGWDFIENLCHAYPNISLNWLVKGTGRMYSNVPEDFPAAANPASNPSARVEDKPSEDSQQLFPTEDIEKIAISEPSEQVFEFQEAVTPKPDRKVKSVIILYNDNTFQIL